MVGWVCWQLFLLCPNNCRSHSRGPEGSLRGGKRWALCLLICLGSVGWVGMPNSSTTSSDQLPRRKIDNCPDQTNFHHYWPTGPLVDEMRWTLESVNAFLQKDENGLQSSCTHIRSQSSLSKSQQHLSPPVRSHSPSHCPPLSSYCRIVVGMKWAEIT